MVTWKIERGTLLSWPLEFSEPCLAPWSVQRGVMSVCMRVCVYVCVRVCVCALCVCRFFFVQHAFSSVDAERGFCQARSANCEARPQVQLMRSFWCGKELKLNKDKS